MPDIIEKIEKSGYHPTSEKLVQVLCRKTQNTEEHFFRTLVGYSFSKVASMMRGNIITKDMGSIPINSYVINLAPSGHGKGHSTNIIEEQIIKNFREKFLESTFPAIAEQSIYRTASQKALNNSTSIDDEEEKIKKEFEDLGPLPFSFDSGTTAAIKQIRQKLLIACAGSMNLEIDEIGSNLVGNTEALNTYLEMYDVGKIKLKLIKNSSDNKRAKDIDGRTPANMMLYGTPTKLFDSGKTEEAFLSFLDTGYARRCLVGYISKTNKGSKLTPKERYLRLTDKSSEKDIQDLDQHMIRLADLHNFNKKIDVSEDVSVLLIEYRTYCEKRTDMISEYDDIRRSEMTHRYFKALKLAGAYAFIDSATEITETTLLNAIKVVEDSGDAFKHLLNREKDHVKLAKFIANSELELTQVDLTDALPFYRGPEGKKREMFTYAIAYGHKNNIILKKSYLDGIEFFSGETIRETDLNELIVSYSQHAAYDYRSERISFDNLAKLCGIGGMQWINHHLVNGKDGQGHRTEDNCLPKSNIVVLDVDGTATLKQVETLFKDFAYIIYTTKRHNPGVEDRFRIILPMSHEIKLEADEYKQFLSNIADTLPFSVDTSTLQRSRKWIAGKDASVVKSNQGKLFDILPYIPRTKRNEDREKELSESSLTNIERWFLNNTASGNRSNQLIRYAFLLVDSGLQETEIKQKISDLNKKLSNPLPKSELDNTIMRSAIRRLNQQP